MVESTQSYVELLVEMWNTGNPALVSQLYTEDAERMDPGSTQPATGVEQIAAYVAEVRTGFPDFHIEITRGITEGHNVAHGWTCTGTHRGMFQGIPPTGKRVEVKGATISRLRDGRIAEERAFFDRVSLLQQLGVLPEQPAAQR